MVFGPNATGKSHLIKGIRALQAILETPHSEGFNYPWYIPFEHSLETENAPTSLGIRLIIENTLYCYEISFDVHGVVSESLTGYPEGRKNAVFFRNRSNYRFGRVYAKGQKPISQMTNPFSAYLTVAAQSNNRLCWKIHRAIVEDIRVLPDNWSSRLYDAIVLMVYDNRVKDMLIRSLDITDFRIRDIGWNHGSSMDLNLLGTRIWSKDVPPEDLHMWVRHRAFEESGKNMSNSQMDLESKGLTEMIGIMAPIIDALIHGTVVVIDDFASALHPLIVKWVVSLFSLPHNVHGAQLIAVSNNHALERSLDMFREDQIYYTHRDNYTGSTELYSLFDYSTGWGVEDTHEGISDPYRPVPYVSEEMLLNRRD